MATMLCYVLTDLDIPKAALEVALKQAVTNTFNTISVDGDQSTSDTVLAVSSQKVAYKASEDEAEFAKALKQVCLGLSEDIVRNGEGTQHVVKITTTGAPTDIFARDVGRFVINSNLVKCAIAGCDPNVGRIVGAIGSYLGTLPGGASLAQGLSVTLGGIDIFKNGAFQLDPTKEKILSDYMLDAQLFPTELPEKERRYPPHSKTVDITVAMATGGTGTAIVIGSDLTKEYVEENADYRS
jgi:glutamate N-acetyltransferase/amino-acid N-acetyltransferase